MVVDRLVALGLFWCTDTRSGEVRGGGPRTEGDGSPVGKRARGVALGCLIAARDGALKRVPRTFLCCTSLLTNGPGLKSVRFRP